MKRFNKRKQEKTPKAVRKDESYFLARAKGNYSKDKLYFDEMFEGRKGSSFESILEKPDEFWKEYQQRGNGKLETFSQLVRNFGAYFGKDLLILIKKDGTHLVYKKSSIEIKDFSNKMNLVNFDELSPESLEYLNLFYNKSYNRLKGREKD